MKSHLFLVLAAALLPSSCDKASSSKSEAEDETGDFEEEESEAEEPAEVKGFFCSAKYLETDPVRAVLSCEKLADKVHFELPTIPVPKTIKVLVDGAEVPADGFVYDEVTNEVEVLQDLADKKLEISYEPKEISEETPPPSADGLTTGTVVDLTGLDGCKFLIQLATGKRLEPTNLAAEFKKDGLEVSFKYEEQKDLASACMAGKIVTVTEMVEKAK